jgi:YD repeat-containing protein
VSGNPRSYLGRMPTSLVYWLMFACSPTSSEADASGAAPSDTAGSRPVASSAFLVLAPFELDDAFANEAHANCRVTFSNQNLGSSYELEFNHAGRVVERDGRVVATYDESGVYPVSDGGSYTWTWAEGYLISERVVISETETGTTEYTYDESGRRTADSWSVWTYVELSDGAFQYTRTPVGSEATRWTFDADGHLVEESMLHELESDTGGERVLSTTTYTWEDGRLTKVDWGREEDTYTYDEHGRVAQVTNVEHDEEGGAGTAIATWDCD